MATKLTTLDAVNIILSNVGQAPVSALDNANPMVSMASNILDEVTEAVQSEGWSFNLERAYPFIPDVNGEVGIPTNAIRIDAPATNDLQLIVRQNKLYDKYTHSYDFSKYPKLSLDVTWLFDFDDMPQPARQYVTIRAANLFAGRAVGSAEQVRFGEKEESIARATLIEYECQQGNWSMVANPANQKVPGYRPYDVIARY
jgi:hypothetical protein